MATDNDPKLAAEQRARVLIDRQLVDAGWSVQDKKDLNLFAAQGVACREVVMKQGHGRADYLLYVCLLYTSGIDVDGWGLQAGQAGERRALFLAQGRCCRGGRGSAGRLRRRGRQDQGDAE